MSYVHVGVLSCLSCVRLFVTPWTVRLLCPWDSPAKKEHWSGFPCPPPGDLPKPGIKPVSLMSPALAGTLFNTSVTREARHVP